MPISSKRKRQFRHYSRKKAQDAVWVVESRNNFYVKEEAWGEFFNPKGSIAGIVPVTVEERWTPWQMLLEHTVHPKSSSIIAPLKAPMLPRTLEQCIPIACREHSRWEFHHVGMSKSYINQVRLRNTVNNDIIPAELFV